MGAIWAAIMLDILFDRRKRISCGVLAPIRDTFDSG